MVVRSKSAATASGLAGVYFAPKTTRLVTEGSNQAVSALVGTSAAAGGAGRLGIESAPPLSAMEPLKAPKTSKAVRFVVTLSVPEP